MLGNVICLNIYCSKMPSLTRQKTQTASMLSRNVNGFRVGKPLLQKHISTPEEMFLRTKGQVRVNKWVHGLHKWRFKKHKISDMQLILQHTKEEATR